jgi:hypothetical protein
MTPREMPRNVDGITWPGILETLAPILARFETTPEDVTGVTFGPRVIVLHLYPNRRVTYVWEDD